MYLHNATISWQDMMGDMRKIWHTHTHAYKHSFGSSRSFIKLPMAMAPASLQSRKRTRSIPESQTHAIAAPVARTTRIPSSVLRLHHAFHPTTPPDRAAGARPPIPDLGDGWQGPCEDGRFWYGGRDRGRLRPTCKGHVSCYYHRNCTAFCRVHEIPTTKTMNRHLSF